MDYADTTPDIAYVYDAMGRQTSATDAVGITTFTYDAFGQLTSEQTSGLYSKTLTRYWDNFGRNIGYSVDNERKQSITYDSATGRIVESDGFAWKYLAGSNLKSKLTYPNEAVVTWTYEPHRDLLTTVTNATYSTYVYTNDLLGRRTSKNNEQYSYNVRDELIAADEVSYAYDDIGNRTTAEGKTYTANNLNQYTAIDDFVPQYDDDGNQTLIKTETGIWSVLYNAENRPIRWESGDTVITMAFDRMGRRVEMRTVKDGAETLQCFVYDNYLCIQQLRGADNALFHSYVWDPTEPIATRPLVFLPASDDVAYYFHDGNKNVSDLVDIRGSVVHYDYTPFGSPTVFIPSANPFAFSSEYIDDNFALIYYTYRHYNPLIGRWNSRDLSDERVVTLLYPFINNNPVESTDILGLVSDDDAKLMYGEMGSCVLSLQKINGKRKYVQNEGIADAIASLSSIAKRNNRVYRKAPPANDVLGQRVWNIIKNSDGGVDKSMGANYYCINKKPPCGNNLTCATCRCDGTAGWRKGTQPLKVIERSQLHVGQCTVYFYDFDKANVVSGWCTQKDQRNSYAHPKECK